MSDTNVSPLPRDALGKQTALMMSAATMSGSLDVLRRIIDQLGDEERIAWASAFGEGRSLS